MDDLRRLQLLELNLLKEVIMVCQKYNLTYYVIGGTLLGAARHKGFIPWDDDIDIAMPRKDFEKLKTVMPKGAPAYLELSYYNTDTTARVRDLIMRAYDSRTAVQWDSDVLCNIVRSCWIDIFPLDGTPNNSFFRQLYYARVYYYRVLQGICNTDSVQLESKVWYEQIMGRMAKAIPVKKLLNPFKVKSSFEKLISSYSPEKSTYSGTLIGRYRTREIVPSSYFGKGATVEFEGMKVNAPERVHEYLTHMYGDYMQLPPAEQQYGHKVKILKLPEMEWNT